jgi:2-polyprenyl-3-methyl-5-hydroxy-6-metoxy-1,4-benzoquinol methylase
MNTPACPICEKHETKRYHSKNRAVYFRCTACETIFQYPLPTLQEMMNYANTEYDSGVYKEYLKADGIKYDTFEYRLDKVLSVLKQKNHSEISPRILDVGCSNGRFIEVARNRGLDAWGLEFSESAITAAAPEVKSRIYQGDANDIMSLDVGKFDVVTAFDLIEHLFDPITFLKNLRYILAEDGLIVFTTPDSSSFIRIVMGKYWPMLQPFQHTILLSRKSAATLLNITNYDPVFISGTQKVFTFDYLFGQLQAPTPSIYYAYNKTKGLLPRSVREKKFQIGIGEMMVGATISVL